MKSILSYLLKRKSEKPLQQPLVPAHEVALKHAAASKGKEVPPESTLREGNRHRAAESPRAGVPGKNKLKKGRLAAAGGAPGNAARLEKMRKMNHPSVAAEAEAPKRAVPGKRRKNGRLAAAGDSPGNAGRIGKMQKMNRPSAAAEAPKRVVAGKKKRKNGRLAAAGNSPGNAERVGKGQRMNRPPVAAAGRSLKRTERTKKRRNMRRRQAGKALSGGGGMDGL